jgi:hypothetical protein
MINKSTNAKYKVTHIFKKSDMLTKTSAMQTSARSLLPWGFNRSCSFLEMSATHECIRTQVRASCLSLCESAYHLQEVCVKGSNRFENGENLLDLCQIQYFTIACRNQPHLQNVYQNRCNISETRTCDTSYSLHWCNFASFVRIAILFVLTRLESHVFACTPPLHSVISY